MSATMDVNSLKKYLNTQNVITVEGRSFPIEIHHLITPEKNYIDAICSTIMQIHLIGTCEKSEKNSENYENGDILVFLPGQEDI